MEGRMLARKPHIIQRLYLEETLLASELKDDSGMSKEVLRLVEQRGRIVAETHGDLTVLASCWETMFFSTRFELQQRAAAFLKENVKVGHFLLHSVIPLNTESPQLADCSLARPRSPAGSCSQVSQRGQLPQTDRDRPHPRPGRLREDALLRGIARVPV